MNELPGCGHEILRLHDEDGAHGNDEAEHGHEDPLLQLHLEHLDRRRRRRRRAQSPRASRRRPKTGQATKEKMRHSKDLWEIKRKKRK